jgi:hypothetical protein
MTGAVAEYGFTNFHAFTLIKNRKTWLRIWEKTIFVPNNKNMKNETNYTVKTFG